LWHERLGSLRARVLAMTERCYSTRYLRRGAYVLLLCAPVSLLWAQSVSAFPPPKLRFDAARVPVGSLLHYIKSNRDGTHPDDLYLYVQSVTHLDTLKLEHGAKAQQGGKLEPVAVNSIGEMDWKTFSAGRVEMWYRFANAQPILMLRATRQPGSKEQHWERRDATGRMVPQPPIELPFLPAHIFGWEFIETMFTLPHLEDQRSSFRIGLLLFNANANDGEPLFRFAEADFRYSGTETHEGKACWKYRISGRAFSDRSAWVWMEERSHHVVDFQSEVPNSPDWNDLRIKLVSMSRISRKQWIQTKSKLTRDFLTQESQH
jgi:hypothetical protein